jgi:SAM-dependent methyltransferase
VATTVSIAREVGPLDQNSRGAEAGTRSSDANAFYSELYTRHPEYSRPIPALEEAQRLGSILPLVSRAARSHAREYGSAQMQMLDLGCGRGWLTYVLDLFGPCEGVDPVADVIEAARSHFPRLRFFVGTARDLLERGFAAHYDLVVSSEVIEHVPRAEKDKFVEELRALLKPAGAAIITTPRGELWSRWRRLGGVCQPVEDWLSEREVAALFRAHGFAPVAHTRASPFVPWNSRLHRVYYSPRVGDLLKRSRVVWLREGVGYALSLHQVWLFQGDTATS